MKWLILALLFVLHLAAGVACFIAMTVPYLFRVWWVDLALLVGIAFWKRPRWFAYVLVGAVSVTLLAIVVLWSAPIHALYDKPLNEVVITYAAEEWSIHITDPNELRRFESYLRRGGYASMIKSGYYYHVDLGTGADGKAEKWTAYHVHGDAFGPRRGCEGQTIFVPHESGFVEFFEGLLAKYGHPRKSHRARADDPNVHPASSGPAPGN